MCIAIPGKIIEINGDHAKTDFNGNILDVNVGLVEARVGKYVLVHAGCAIEILEQDRAQEILDLFSEMTE